MSRFAKRGRRVARAGAVVSAGVALLCALGCSTLRPDYQRPAVALPESFSEPGLVASGTATEAWWKFFGDATLDGMVAEALERNQDLAAAAARIDEARALAGLVHAERFPQVSGSAAASRSRISADTAQLPPEVPVETTRLRVGVDLTYEIDFWGRIKAATAAARATLLASEHGRRALELAVSGEVVAAYLDLAALRREHGLAEETLASRTEAVRLQRLRFDAGTISELDLAQAQAELAATEATVPGLERALRQTETRLLVLLGRFGGRVAVEPNLEALVLPEVPVGLPSELLLRRPDVLSAEQGLVAANARVATARAAYFPLISLTAGGGTESRQLSDLLSSGTGVWQAALSLVQPIWNAGRTKRQVEAARARERQALAVYLKAIQTSLAEVEDALAARRAATDEREALERQAEALGRARYLANLRYEAGDSSYLEVLDADRNLFQAQRAALRARRDERVAAVNLFRALGGGWASGDAKEAE